LKHYIDTLQSMIQRERKKINHRNWTRQDLFTNEYTKRIHRKRFETNFLHIVTLHKDTLFSPFSLSIEKSSKESDTFTGNGVGCNRRLMFSVQRTEAPCLRVWGSAPHTSRVRHRSRSGGTVVARRHGRPGYEPSTFTLTLRNTVTCCRGRESKQHTACLSAT